MPEAISKTSPLLYLYRIGGLEWLAKLFGQVWVAEAVADELQYGKSRGYDVPMPADYSWLRLVQPRCIPSAWLALDLGSGELGTMTLALENVGHVVLLDDALARRVAQAAGLETWGTLKVLLEVKSHGMIESVAPYVNRLSQAGMWLSEDIKDRILRLAGESP